MEWKHLIQPSEQLHPKDCPLAAATQGIRAGVCQELPRGTRASNNPGSQGWDVFQLCWVVPGISACRLGRVAAGAAAAGCPHTNVPGPPVERAGHQGGSERHRDPSTLLLLVPPCPHPVPQSLGEATSHLPRCLEELVGEMLGEEGKHHVGASGISLKLLPQQEPLCQELGVRELQLPCKGWRLREDALCRPSWVLVLSAGLLVVSAAASGTDSSVQRPCSPLTQAVTCPNSSA